MLARVQGQRFFIEHAFREAKSECAMADYQVRRWDAWHHHMALVMLAALFLVKQKVAHRETWPMLSLNDLVTAIAPRQKTLIDDGWPARIHRGSRLQTMGYKSDKVESVSRRQWP